MEKIVEERSELCSVASKIVKVKIFRSQSCSCKEGEIVGFECAEKSSSCESRCTYLMMLEDF